MDVSSDAMLIERLVWVFTIAILLSNDIAQYLNKKNTFTAKYGWDKKKCKLAQLIGSHRQLGVSTGLSGGIFTNISAQTHSTEQV